MSDQVAHSELVPPPSALPTEEELLTLPRWALVAYAIRCALRVQTVYVPSTEAQFRYARDLDRYLQAAIRLAQSGGVKGSDDDTPTGYGSRSDASAHEGAYYAGICASMLAGSAATPPPREHYAVDSPGAIANMASRHFYHSDPGSGAAYGAAFATAVMTDPIASSRRLYEEALTEYRRHQASRASEVAKWAVKAKPSIRSQLRRDFDLLRAMSLHKGWTDATPVSPDTLGPLEPEGDPRWWVIPPLDNDRAHRILAGDIRPEDYLTVPEEVMAAVVGELERFGAEPATSVSREMKQRLLNDWTLSLHHGGQPVACQFTESGVIVFAIGTTQIKAFLEQFPRLEDRSQVVITTPELWQSPNLLASPSH